VLLHKKDKNKPFSDGLYDFVDAHLKEEEVRIRIFESDNDVLVGGTKDLDVIKKWTKKMLRKFSELEE
jgi:hypothetical protein